MKAKSRQPRSSSHRLDKAKVKSRKAKVIGMMLTTDDATTGSFMLPANRVFVYSEPAKPAGFWYPRGHFMRTIVPNLEVVQLANLVGRAREKQIRPAVVDAGYYLKFKRMK